MVVRLGLNLVAASVAWSLRELGTLSAGVVLVSGSEILLSLSTGL